LKLPALDGYVLWLLPDHPSEIRLREPIERISKTVNAYPFHPHITIGNVPDIDSGKLTHLLPQIADGIEPFVIQAKSVECRENPYQKLIIVLESHSRLLKVADSIDRIFGKEFGKRDDHHISILYADLHCSELSTERENLKKSFSKSFAINKIALTRLKGTPDEWEIDKVCELKG